MNKEEMIRGLQSLKKRIEQHYQDLWHYEEMLDEVIGIIEVSEDAISRATALEIYSDLYWIDERLLNFKSELDKVYDDLRNAPSVIPQVPSEDCVDRYSVLAELNPLSYEYKAIKELPSVILQTKEGEWIEIGTAFHSYKCSVCGRMLVNITDGKKTVAKNYPYCHCGAKMKGKERIKE